VPFGATDGQIRGDQKGQKRRPGSKGRRGQTKGMKNSGEGRDFDGAYDLAEARGEVP